MTAYLITYDLNQPGQNYAGLLAALRQAGAVQILYSTWVERSSENSVQLRERYTRHLLDANDRIMVCAMTSDWASRSIMNQDAALRILPA